MNSDLQAQLDELNKMADDHWIIKVEMMLNTLSAKTAIGYLSGEFDSRAFYIETNETFKINDSIIVCAHFIEGDRRTAFRVIKKRCTLDNFDLYQVQAFVNIERNTNDFSAYVLLLGKAIIDEMPMLNVKIIIDENGDNSNINKKMVEVNNAFISRPLNFEDCFLENTSFVFRAIRGIQGV